MTKTRKIRKIRKNIIKKISKRGGGQLPPASVSIPQLPNICSLENVYKDNKSTSYQTGGLLPTGYVGPTWGELTLSNFVLTNQQLITFRRLFTTQSYMDCVISAMQIIGIFDFYTANILRITKLSKIGFELGEIELIFSLRLNKKFNFVQTNNINEFIQYVSLRIKPGHCIFCGTQNRNGFKHVFLIAKSLDNIILKIDPQSPNKFCSLETHQDCIKEFAQDNILFFVLLNYTGDLTSEEQLQMGFIL